MKRSRCFFIFLLLIFAVIASSAHDLFCHKPDFLPSDKKATKETIKLYQHLFSLAEKGFMFGHQDDLAYGVGWKYKKGRSDVKDVTGDYPAVYGWELGGLELDQLVNLDSVPFNKMQQFIKESYEKGGVITISWHLHNPLTGKTAWDPSAGTVASVLPGGTKHELFKTWLDKVAVFMKGLKGKHGEFIPVIFRPFHELNGNWFWWGGNHCTPDEFKKLWMFTVNYLQNEKMIHHLLYAYNTDRFTSREEYLEKYPGSEWVDIIGVDIYQKKASNDKFKEELDHMLTMLTAIAIEKNKLPALTEFGGNLSTINWWTDVFLKGIGNHKISYVLGWRNAGLKANGEFEFYVPYKGQMTSKNFIEFFQSEKTFFLKDISNKKLYQYSIDF
jgi:Glycosyl hydrolase family 26